MVTAANTLQLLLGWEGMGVCSFMLIGHWWEDKPNSDAALKAFLTTRTGDIGLLIGIIMTVLRWPARPSTSQKINDAALAGHRSATPCCWWPASPCSAAVIGKSAQFPLHTWLPDAMAGPTPVSALIHAATMVVAGVYLVGPLLRRVLARPSTSHAGPAASTWSPSSAASPSSSPPLLAFVQNDIKKVLAYSTISQLGYMVMALGVGAWTGGHLPPLHPRLLQGRPVPRRRLGQPRGSHHSFDMKKDMGGLRKYMPITFGTFVIGIARPGRHLPAGRLLVEGRDPGRRRPQRLHAPSWSSASSAPS